MESSGWTTTRRILFGLLCGASVGLGLYIWVSPYLGGECVVICEPYRAVIVGAAIGALIAVAWDRNRREKRELRASQIDSEVLKRRKQKRALWTGTILFCLAGIFPPWTEKTLSESGQVVLEHADRYRLLWDEPSVNEAVEAASVDVERLLIGWAVIFALTAAKIISAGMETEQSQPDPPEDSAR